MNNTKKQGMKWFYFLIYFLLWLRMLSLAVSGIYYLTRVYNNTFILFAKPLYTRFPLLQSMDLIIGIVNIIIALLYLVIRFRLAKFKKGAATMYIKVEYTILFLTVLSSTCLDIINVFALEPAMRPDHIILFLISELASLVLTFALNFIIYKLEKIYFKKREHLFVN